MKTMLFVLTFSCLVMTACSASVSQHENIPPSTPTTFEQMPTEDVRDTLQQHEQDDTKTDNFDTGSKKLQERKGELDLDHIEVVGVKGDLLASIMSLLNAVKAKDDEGRKLLTYDPVNFDEFKGQEPYILAVTKLERDDSRVDDVTYEYNLKSFADDVAIVKISFRKIGDDLKESISTGDYIFVKIKNQWKLYRFQ